MIYEEDDAALPEKSTGTVCNLLRRHSDESERAPTSPSEFRSSPTVMSQSINTHITIKYNTIQFHDIRRIDDIAKLQWYPGGTSTNKSESSC